MNTKALATVAAILLASSATAQQPTASARPDLASVLGTPEYQWVFNHICVPIRVLSGAGYTNGDFVTAYLAVAEVRWKASLDAQARKDQDGSMKAVAPILHSVIDLHWPNRVQRNSSGAITRFRDCEELGNLQGMLQEEKAGAGWTGALKEQATNYLTQVIRKWKDGRSFQEVAEILRSGPMKFSEEHSNVALGQ
jgi:hypothetical protein